MTTTHGYQRYHLHTHLSFELWNMHDKLVHRVLHADAHYSLMHCNTDVFNNRSLRRTHMYTLSKSPKVNASCFHKEKYVGRHVATSVAILSPAHHVEGRHKSSKIYLLLKTCPVATQIRHHQRHPQRFTDTYTLFCLQLKSDSVDTLGG